MRYEGNPKHKHPYQPGRRGSLCPPDINTRVAQAMLEESIRVGKARYAIREGQPFCAREHDQGRWHGYPVVFREVPHDVRAQRLRQNAVKKSQLRKNW